MELSEALKVLIKQIAKRHDFMSDEICVILVNYNGKKYNRACIESVMRSTCDEKLNIIVVDNASVDGSFEELKELYAGNTNVYFIGLNDNYGFSKANNEGIRWALARGYRYIMLLNNDTEVESWTINRMISLQRRTGDMIVPKILYADEPDRIWYAGGILSPIIMKPKHRGAEEKDKNQYDKNERCTFANGCCILLTDRIIHKLGLLDERFFLYYEDTEYSMRARKHEVGISYCGEAVVYHKVNGSSKGNDNPANAYYISRNWLMCNKMHMGMNFIFFYLYFILNRLCWAVIWLAEGKLNLVQAMWRGIADFQKGKCGKY